MWLFNLLFSSLSQLWYVEVRISRSVSVSPLEFEITGVDCIWIKNWSRYLVQIIHSDVGHWKEMHCSILPTPAKGQGRWRGDMVMVSVHPSVCYYTFVRSICHSLAHPAKRARPLKGDMVAIFRWKVSIGSGTTCLITLWRIYDLQNVHHLSQMSKFAFLTVDAVQTDWEEQNCHGNDKIHNVYRRYCWCITGSTSPHIV